MQCYSCKGKLKCGLKFCPMNKTYFKVVDKEGFDGSSPPAVFVGSKLYPDANVGILSPAERDEEAWIYNNQRYWADNNLSIKDVLTYRSSLINSRFRTHVKSSSKFLDIAREIGVTLKPVDIEVELQQKIRFKLNFDQINLPSGPTARLKKLRVTSNVKVPNKIDKAISDTDLKANDALIYLSKNYDEATLMQILSLGVLGIKKNRKLVPSKWAITCVHDVLAKNLLKSIKYCNVVEDHKLYFGNYMGNYYLVMIFPDVFQYELFELFLPKSAWNPTIQINCTTDYENFYGRKKYAERCGGGYYSVKLGLVEKLNKINRQGSVLVIRFETPEYWASLGVWITLVAIRKAMNNEPFIFKTRKEMLDHARKLILNKFKFDIDSILNQSKVLKNIKQQKKLTSFL